MTKKSVKYQAHAVEDVIITIRGQKVILDSALAQIYGVETKRLKEQVRRNKNRFPSDFMLQLTTQEVRSLRSQIATGSLKHSAGRSVLGRGRNKYNHQFEDQDLETKKDIVNLA